MSSKNVSSSHASAHGSQGKEPSPAAPHPARRRRTWSITRRLTLHYIGSTATLLLLASGFLYWKLEQSLVARDQALLAGKVQVLSLLLREHPDKTDVLTNEVEHEHHWNGRPRTAPT